MGKENPIPKGTVQSKLKFRPFTAPADLDEGSGDIGLHGTGVPYSQDPHAHALGYGGYSGCFG